MGGLVLSPNTLEWSDVVAAKVLTHLVCPCCESLLPSTVLNALVSVNTPCTQAGACINHLSEARECCSSPSKNRLHRTAAPIGWCLHVLFRFESHESPCVTSITHQRFSAHHNYWYTWVGASCSHTAWNMSVSLPFSYQWVYT